jgi:hypothetical protein
VRRFTTGIFKVKEQIIELVPNQKFSYRLLSGLPVTNYEATVTLESVASKTNIKWEATFETSSLIKRPMVLLINIILKSMANDLSKA